MTTPTCESCAYRLDVTLWGLWLATGCRAGLVLRRGCMAYAQVWSCANLRKTDP
jgi:hypothetical protein